MKMHSILCNLSNQNKSVILTKGAMHNMLNPDQFTMYANNCTGTSNKMANEEAQDMQLQNELYNVYPNPTSKGFYINASEQKGIIEVKVLDLQGKVVLHQFCELGKTPCYIATNLVNGLYIVNIVNNETNTKYHTKLAINN